MLLLAQPSLLLKEFAEDASARIGQHAGNDLRTMVQTRIAEQMIERVDGACLGIRRAVDDDGQPGLEDGSRRTSGKARASRTRCSHPAATTAALGRLGDGDHFGVGRGVVKLLPLVVGAGNHPAAMDNHRADGHFVFTQRLFGLGQGQLHESFVVDERQDHGGEHRSSLHDEFERFGDHVRLHGALAQALDPELDGPAAQGMGRDLDSPFGAGQMGHHANALQDDDADRAGRPRTDGQRPIEPLRAGGRQRRLDPAASIVQANGQDLPPLRLDGPRSDGHHAQLVIAVAKLRRVQQQRPVGPALGLVAAIDGQQEGFDRSPLGQRGGGPEP